MLAARPVSMAFSLQKRVLNEVEECSPPSSPAKPFLEKASGHETVVSELLSLLTCPVCLTVMAGVKIESCRNEHLVCSNCSPKLDQCPVCRGPWGVRSRLAKLLQEAVLGNLINPCWFKEYGCRHRCPYQKMPEHLVWCKYQQVDCPAALTHGCSWQGCLKNLLPHIKKNKCGVALVSEKHKKSKIYQVLVEFSLSADDWLPRHVVLESAACAEVLVCLSLVPSDGRVMFFFRTLGELPSSYISEATLRILRPYGHTGTYSFSGMLHSPTQSLGTIKGSGNFLDLTAKQVLSRLNQDGFLRLLVTFPLLQGVKAECCDTLVEQQPSLAGQSPEV